MMNSPGDVLAAVAEQARTLASATHAWAISVEGDVVLGRASAPSDVEPPPAAGAVTALLRAARASLVGSGVAREGDLVIGALPDASGHAVVGLVLVIATDAGASNAATSAAGFDAALRELCILGGLRLENARLRTRIESVTKAREVLLASVSHDLRNPLNTFAMSAGLLRDDLERKEVDPARGLTLVTRMERATSRMQSMIEDLVEASRVDAGAVVYAAKAESAAQLVRDAARAAEPKGKEKAAAVVPEALDETASVLVDRGRTLQLLAKVVQFISKATGDSGAIHISVAAEQDQVRFTATGYGPGKMKLGKPEEGRAGLPLLLARGLVAGQKGTFSLDTADGMTVTFTLPAAG
ncbi:MAG: Sensory box histidine kinase [Labilithrix sp.]|nr:Sensory box histidine kinase [Labilithrix sp.]